MKKTIISFSIAGCLFWGGMLADGAEAATKSIDFSNQSSTSAKVITNSIPHPGDGYTWKWYYTDYSLSNGWYEKWYKYEDGAGTHYMVKTYDSNGNLKRTRYL